MRGGPIMAFVDTVFLTLVPLLVAAVAVLSVALLKDHQF